MKYMVLLFVVMLTAGCGSQQQQQAEEQRGTAGDTMGGEVISADDGYIVQNAGIAGKADEVAFSIKGVVNLKSSTSQVLVVQSRSRDGKATEMLVLEFPSFAEGTERVFSPDDNTAGFWVFGMTKDRQEVMQRTGTIEGHLRLAKIRPAANSLGLNRDMSDGTGDMEIVVTGIDNGGLDIPVEKKYAARYQLPMISLDEFARINRPI
jgi:hypothetical protein